NRYMEQQAPWKLVKSDLPAAGRVLGTAAEALRFSALLLRPVMPNRSQQVLSILNAENSRLIWGDMKAGARLETHDALFPRIEVKKFDAPKTPKLEDGLNVITYAEFEQCELKTAKILTAERVPDADRLLKLSVDLGAEKRQIVAGIAEYYSPEELPGKIIIVVANLEPATIRGLKSEGMLLAAKKGKKLCLLTVDGNDTPPGVRVF
ncbi:MAG: methionine--tRNA ligase subunit beta, partial [FCB group bacterium]|nr:methionine--tRNA ligase subunit beta [FCB group bacterium]